MDILKEGLIQCGIQKERVEEVSAKIETYIKEIILFNSAYNLTNTSDHDELVIRHILDSLAAYKPLFSLAQKLSNDNPLFTIADIGSGGGLPGIPLSIVFPEYNFSLVERMSKRCAFLENCAAILGLKNVKVYNLEAEKVDEEAFDIAVFRAFRPLDVDMTKTLLRLTKTGGYLAAYKAKLENIRAEMEGIKNLAKDYSIVELKVPFLTDSERNLVLVNKTKTL